MRVACEEAKKAVWNAYHGAAQVCNQVSKADAILLEFDYAEWERPWLLPQYRPALAMMLYNHGISERYYEGDDTSDENPNTFGKLVLAEEAKARVPDTFLPSAA